MPWVAEAVARALHQAGIEATVTYTGAEFGYLTYCRIRFTGLSSAEAESGHVEVEECEEDGPYIKSPTYLIDCGFIPAV